MLSRSRVSRFARSSLVVAGLTASSGLAQGTKPNDTKAAPAAAPTPGGHTKSFTASKLSNGLELVMMDVRKVPLVTIVLTVKAGAMTETPQTNGLTHLWEHMFFKGNKRIPNQEAFNKKIRELGIVYNGDTSAEKVRYYFTLPSAMLDEGLQFMADAIATPLLDQAELEKERRVVLNEYERSAASPAFDFNNLERAIIYGDQQYQRDPLGQRKWIENATREQLFRIKDEVFVPSNSALLIAGDFEPEATRKLVEKHFSSWKDPSGWQPVKRPPFPPFPKTVTWVMTRPNARNASTQITFNGPKASEEPQDTFAADVLIHLLQHKSGKFYSKYVDSGLTYGAGLAYYTQSRAGEVTLFASTEPTSVVHVQKMLLDEIKAWLDPNYFSEEQLADVRRNLLINYKRELNQTTEYVKTLGFWWAVTGFDYYNGYLDSLGKTGLPEVRAFVQKWLVDKPYLAGILLSPEDAKKAGLRDTSSPLVAKYLANYREETPAAPANGKAPAKGDKKSKS